MKREISEKGKRARKKIIIDSLMILFVVLAPFIFKIHQYLPRDPDATLNFFGFVFHSNGFADLSTYAWFLLGKIIPLYLLLIWFFTCRHWWYYAILIPILMYAFQLFEVIYSEDQIVDSKNIIWLLPICMVVVPIVYFIRIKLYDKHVHGIDLDAMEAELETYQQKGMVPEKSSEDLEQDLAKLENESFTEKIDRILSTRNIEYQFKQLQDNLRNWLQIKT